MNTELELALNWPPLPPSPCPDNNFGRGKGVDLDEAQRVEVLNEWEEWDRTHPDDPEGLVYLARYNELAKAYGLSFTNASVLPDDPTPLEKPLPYISKEGVTTRGPGRPPVIAVDTDVVERRYLIRHEQFEAFKALSRRTGRSMSDYLREAVDQIIERNI